MARQKNFEDETKKYKVKSILNLSVSGGMSNGRR